MREEIQVNTKENKDEQQTKGNKVEHIPITVLIAQRVQQKPLMNRPFLCLLDSGTTGCWISRTRLQQNIQGKTVAEVTSQTLAGTFTSNQEIQLEQVMLPEFFKTRKIDYVQAKIFTTPCRYDMILGRDLLNDLGIILDFKNKSMEWDQAQIPMRSYPNSHNSATTATEWLLDAVDNDLVGNDETLTRVSDTTPHQVNETKYQEKDVDPDGYMFKLLQNQLCEGGGLHAVLHMCPTLTNMGPSTTTKGDIDQMSPANITLLSYLHT